METKRIYHASRRNPTLPKLPLRDGNLLPDGDVEGEGHPSETSSKGWKHERGDPGEFFLLTSETSSKGWKHSASCIVSCRSQLPKLPLRDGNTGACVGFGKIMELPKLPLRDGNLVSAGRSGEQGWTSETSSKGWKPEKGDISRSF